MSEVEEIINKCVNDIWGQYDKDGNGHLDKKEAKAFVLKTIVNMQGETKFTDQEFEECFKEFDKDGSGTIEKSEMAIFIKKVAGL